MVLEGAGIMLGIALLVWVTDRYANGRLRMAARMGFGGRAADPPRRPITPGAAPAQASGARLEPRAIGAVMAVRFEREAFTADCLETWVDGKALRWVHSGGREPQRVDTLFSKEPTTIPWLEAMEPGELLVDVGANMGLYSIYAAVLAGVRVCAFEPEALNFAELNKNILVNGLHDRVTAYCLALSDETAVGELHLGAFGYAYAHHDFHENRGTVNPRVGDTVTPRPGGLRQGSLSARLDDLVGAGTIPCPAHVKIDVDGLEHRVVAGARRTLADPRVRSVLIEVNFGDPRNGRLVEEMQDLGWRFSWDQVRVHRKGVLSRARVERMRRRGRGGLNYIFFRDDGYARLFADYRRAGTAAGARR